MKVLWLVSITIPAAADACGLQAKEIGGGWLSGALGGMTAAPDAPAITVASVDARAETLTVCSKSGVSFALVPTGSVENFSALLKKLPRILSISGAPSTLPPAPYSRRPRRRGYRCWWASRA